MGLKMNILRLVRLASVAATVACSIGFGAGAHANPFSVNYTWDGTFGGAFQGTVSYYRNGSLVCDNPAYAGAFTATFNGAGPSYLPSTPFHTYCVDLDHNQYVPGTDPKVNINPASAVAPIYSDNSAHLDVTNRLKQAAWLYDNYDSLVNGTSDSGKAEGVALQLAIWKVIEDSHYLTGDGNVFDEHAGLSEGSYFQATGFTGNGFDALSIASDMLNHLGAKTDDGGVYFGIVNSSGNYDANRDKNSGQNMLMSIPGSHPTGDQLVPEGNSLAMLGLGAVPLVLGFVRMRRRQQRR